MSAERKLDVVLYWHMHQPEYRELSGGRYQQPWTYLHAIKDYVDMAAHLETVKEAKAVVNFVPTLLEQIDDYACQTRAFLDSGDAITDPLLSALADQVLPDDPETRMSLVKACLRANEQRLIEPFPRYQKLVEMARWVLEHRDNLRYINAQFLIDILVWYHLVWLGETVRRSDPRVEKLIEQGGGYSYHDRRELLTVICELLESVIPHYKRLAEQGRVELSMTPYAHPIMPLLLDISSAREAVPEINLPLLERYPGGEERVKWHIDHGLEVFESYFGFRPKGCWPSEGSVSDETLKVLEQSGFQWAACGETVLRNSLSESEQPHCIHRSYSLNDGALRCFFRDDGLSDLIGFEYSSWHADDAVANLVHHLDNIAEACNSSDALVSIILDGENAWEYYPENGYYFLEALYRELAANPRINLTTFSEHLQKQTKPAPLSKLVAGSWVYGTFTTWIGDADKNRGWDMLGEAKRTYDTVIASGRLDEARRIKAERQLAICEGSDWFWWFGDYNPAEAVSQFERLYRLHLSNLYRILGEEPPSYLTQVFTHGSGAPARGGVMRMGKET